MHLVNRNRLVEALAVGPVGQPFLVVPGEIGDIPDHRRGLRPQFGGEAVGVGFLDQIAVVPALDLVLVDLAVAEVGNEDLPDAGSSPVAHRVPPAVPMIEVADHADPLRIGGPDREVHTPESSWCTWRCAPSRS